MTDAIFARIRAEAETERLPVMRERTALLLQETVEKLRPKRILEIGTCIGISGLTALSSCEGVLTTIEINTDLAERARSNFREAGVSERAEVLEGDCFECLKYMELNHYDLVILDGPKGHYSELLDVLKPMINENGVLFADDVSFHGKVNSGYTEHKHRTIVRNMEEFLKKLASDKDFNVKIYDFEDGVAVAYKEKK